MTDFCVKWVACFACCCIVVSSALAWQTEGQFARVERIYVEPFSVKEGTERLREDVISQLRKLNSISLVSNKSTADAILSGNGEIWIKGYRSLNPRSGRLPSNGLPVYAGFLSVELKDVKGETLWSYLATPSAASEDIEKDLSKRVVKHLAEALTRAGHESTTHR
jgi:hypothetical protein